MLSNLKTSIERGTADDVQREIHQLGIDYSERKLIEDEICFEILRLLKNDRMFDSDKAGWLLNFFEYEERKISDKAKDRCRTFLREWGNQFNHFHAQHVIGELLEGRYLRSVCKH